MCLEKGIFMDMVEVWSGDGKNPSLLVHRDYDTLWGYVINGDWNGKFDKVNNTVYVQYTKKTHPCFYLGDCKDEDDYNEIFDELKTGKRKILGKNVIKYKSEEEYEKMFKKNDDEVPF